METCSYTRIYYIPNQEGFKIKLLELMHSCPWGGHSSFDKTIHKVSRGVWPQGCSQKVRQEL